MIKTVKEVVRVGEYERFLELPNEKQLKIINAGFEYFGKYGYKGANTEDIANKAISKTKKATICFCADFVKNY